MKGTTLVIKKTAEIGAALSFLVMNVSRDEGDGSEAQQKQQPWVVIVLNNNAPGQRLPVVRAPVRSKRKHRSWLAHIAPPDVPGDTLQVGEFGHALWGGIINSPREKKVTGWVLACGRCVVLSTDALDSEKGTCDRTQLFRTDRHRFGESKESSHAPLACQHDKLGTS
eukprot:1158808-Pelagomonas_calceolata.AAC.1